MMHSFAWFFLAQLNLVDLSTQKTKQAPRDFVPGRPSLFCSAVPNLWLQISGDSLAHTIADLRYNLMAVAKKNGDVSVPSRRSCLSTCHVPKLGNGNPR
jgi:hypothetical protein